MKINTSQLLPVQSYSKVDIFANLVESISKLLTISQSSSQLDFIEFSEDISIHETAKIINALEEKDYGYLVKRIYYLYKEDKFQNVYSLANRIEYAFNLSRLVIKDHFTILKIEDMQQDLFKIKSFSSKLRFNLNDSSLKSKLALSIKQLLDKLESSRYTHNFLESLETNEEELMKSFEIVEKEKGILELKWKKKP